MATRTTKLALTGYKPKITGDGSDIKLTIEGHRKKKSGVIEGYELTIDLGRWHIQSIARQIATMHERDRARLARETARIEKEIAAIQQPETQS